VHVWIAIGLSGSNKGEARPGPAGHPPTKGACHSRLRPRWRRPSRAPVAATRPQCLRTRPHTRTRIEIAIGIGYRDRDRTRGNRGRVLPSIRPRRAPAIRAFALGGGALRGHPWPPPGRGIESLSGSLSGSGSNKWCAAGSCPPSAHGSIGTAIGIESLPSPPAGRRGEGEGGGEAGTLTLHPLPQKVEREREKVSGYGRRRWRRPSRAPVAATRPRD
jgi:hypothetical protein